MSYLNSYNAISPMVRSLLTVNVIMFLVQKFIGGAFIGNMALWPLTDSVFRGPSFQVSQLVTYGFLHGGVAHLLLNMYALWMFGSKIERLWGQRVFAIYYFTCLIGAGIIQLLVASQGNGPAYPTIGASGAVFGLLLAYGMLFPKAKLFFLFIPFPIEARYFVIFFGAIELFFGVTGVAKGIAHFAHLGGMLFGFILIKYWQKNPPR